MPDFIHRAIRKYLRALDKPTRHGARAVHPVTEAILERAKIVREITNPVEKTDYLYTTDPQDIEDSNSTSLTK